jgi:hypothetical protein
VCGSPHALGVTLGDTPDQSFEEFGAFLQVRTAEFGQKLAVSAGMLQSRRDIQNRQGKRHGGMSAVAPELAP